MRRYRDTAELARGAADETVAIARDALESRGRFRLVLPGGATPRRLLDLLASDAYRSRIAWADTDVFFGDERAVPPDDPTSNFRMAREALLAPLGIAAECIHRMRAERSDLDEAARDYQHELARVTDVSPSGPPPRLDLVMLGMGADAHTASLFPATKALHERERWVVPTRAPVAPFDRMTFTFSTINRARCVLFLVAGADKAAPLAEVLEGDRDPDRLPSQSVRPTDGRLCWLVDDAAASRLTTGAK